MTAFFHSSRQSQTVFHVVLVAEFFLVRTSPSLIIFSGCARRWILFHRSRSSLTFFLMLRSSLICFQVVLIDGFFASSHESFADFFFRLRTSLTFFPGRARCWFFPSLRTSLFSFSWSHDSLADFFFRLCLSWTVFSQLASVATFFFHVGLVAVFFKLWLSMNFLLARTSLSLTSFSGCARRWIFSQVAHVAAFSPGYACRWFFSGSHESIAHYFFRLRPSLNTFSQVAFVAYFFFDVALVANFFSSCAYRWIFCQLARVLCWFLFQVAHVADFFYRSRPLLISFSGCAHRWLFPRSHPLLIFPQVTHVADWFSGWHEYVDDFLFRVRTSLFFSQVAPVADFFQVVPVADFFVSSHESDTDFVFRLRPSLIFFTGRDRHWLLFQVAHIADFFPMSRPLLISHQVTRVADFFSWSHDSIADLFFRFCPSLTAFSHVAPFAKFFYMLLLSLLLFSKLSLSMNFLPARTSPSLTSFSGCAHRWLFPRSRPSLIFSPGYACRWFVFRVARTRRWLPSRVADIADFFPRSRPLLNFLQVTHVADFFSGSHESMAHYFFRVRPSLNTFSQVAFVAPFFWCCARR